MVLTHYPGLHPALSPSMNASQQTSPLSDTIIDGHRLIAGLKHALDVNYARVLAGAAERWQQGYAGKDPSDACVTVRITSGAPTAGVMKKSGRPFLLGGRGLSLA
jgi:hypothetical protein